MFKIIFRKDIYLFFIALSPFIIWCFWQLNRDLWYDESFTLKYFALLSWQETYANYPLPNNHVFHNLIIQFFTRITNLRTESQILDFIYLLRGLHAIISALTIVYIVKFSRLFQSKIDINLLVIILLTTIPFLNFSLQIRGYGLSALLLLISIYYTIFYWQNGRKGIWISVTIALLFYTIPSNIYFIASAGIGLIFILLSARIQKNFEQQRRAFKLMLFYFFGLLIGFLCYAPVLENVISNDFSSKPSPSFFYTFEILWEFLVSIFSSRYFLFFFLIPGIWFFHKQGFSKDKMIVRFLMIVFFGGFLFAFFHQKKPFDRTFVPLIPMLTIIIAVLVNETFQKVVNAKWKGFATFLFLVLSVAVFLWENQRNNHYIKDQLLVKENVLQTVHSSYFLVDEHNLNDNFKFLSEHYDCSILMFEQIDYISVYFYSDRYFCKSRQISDAEEIIQALEKEPKIIVTTTKLNSTLKKIKKLKGIKYVVLRTKKGVMNLIEITRVAK